jgi:hypothetical protein
MNDKIQKITKSIEPVVSLTDEELSIFCNAFEYKSIRKNEFFLKYSLKTGKAVSFKIISLPPIEQMNIQTS